MPKRVNDLLFVIILMSFLSLGFISGAGESCSIVARDSCVSPNHIVMGLSGLTSAHGELASEGNYDYVLCCDFGNGVQVDECDGANKIIGLSSVTNAHAEIPSQSNYLTPICYGDLDCVNLDTSVEGNCDSATIGAYPIDVLSLTGPTNAHIGAIGDYPAVSICCKSPSAPQTCELTDANWSLDGSTSITDDDNPVNKNKEVYLIVGGTNCAGETISFEVLEYDAIGGDDAVVTNPEDVQFGDNAIWEAEYIDDVGNPTYYFIATVDGTSESVESNNPRLEVEERTTLDWCLENEINSCGDYEEADCGNDECNKGYVGNPADCDEVECTCDWDDTANPAVCKPAYPDPGICGNGVINTGETCDGDEFGTLTCGNFDAFTGGTLSCDSNCNIDTSSCTGGTEGDCGDDVINTGETCDGDEFGDFTGNDCPLFDEFTGGTLSCDSNCNFETSSCTGGTSGELCIITQEIISDCDEEPLNFVTYTWADTCGNSGSGETECPAQIQLPFFGFFGVVASLVIISLIYIALIFKRKKE